MDPSGNALAVYQQRIDALITFNVWALRFSSASGWTPPEQISNGAGSAGGAQIANDPQGDGVAVWVQSDAAGNVSAWSNHFDAR